MSWVSGVLEDFQDCICVCVVGSKALGKFIAFGFVSCGMLYPETVVNHAQCSRCFAKITDTDTYQRLRNGEDPLLYKDMILCDAFIINLPIQITIFRSLSIFYS